MLLLIVEVALTVAVWKRGWKGWALPPILIGQGAQFLAGVVIGLTAGGSIDVLSMSRVTLFCLVANGLTVAALTVMLVKARQQAAGTAELSFSQQERRAA